MPGRPALTPPTARRESEGLVMGPHNTWFDFLPGYHTLRENLQHYLGREWTWQMFQATHFQLDHVFGGLLVFLFLAFGAFRYAAARESRRATAAWFRRRASGCATSSRCCRTPSST